VSKAIGRAPKVLPSVVRAEGVRAPLLDGCWAIVRPRSRIAY
jgi:hypothetical protein